MDEFGYDERRLRQWLTGRATRATDVHGTTQPDVARYNTLGYLFDAVVRLPVTAA